MSKFKHSYSAITPNFELEPVIEDYFAKYPRGQFESYQIVYKPQDEYTEGTYSYLVVYKLFQGTKENHVSFYDFLKAHCVRNDLVAAMHPVNDILPRLGDGHTFGKLKK